jgi:hypothetical protein
MMIMVFLSSKEEELAVMLKVMDKVSASSGLRINASKTELMPILKHAKAGRSVLKEVEGCQGVEISEGMVKVLTQVKYLGSMLVSDQWQARGSNGS